MFVRIAAGAVAGIDAVTVSVEVNVAAAGQLGLFLVGLPDNAVKESEQRIRSAFENTGLRMTGKKLVVNLAPADLRKEGAGFDLPIAVGILAATEQVPAEALDGTMLAGELSLDGTLKPVRGILPMAVKAREEGLRRLIVPCDNACEAAVVEGVEVIGAASLGETVEYLRGDRTIAPAAAPAAFAEEEGGYAEDFADVKGQAAVKRALEIAAFVHGAMCMSVSGRCLLSNYMAGRDANRGQCAQPCRWKYYLSEETRPGQLYEIGENENGSYILNANDMCTAPFLDLICNAGVDSLKIEGRAKTFYYVASVTAAYRRALDQYLADPMNENFELPEEVLAELTRTSHRHYSPGFYFGREQARQATDSATYIREWEFVGTVDGWENGVASCQQRGKWSLGDTLEVLCPDGRSIPLNPEWIKNEAGELVESTPHAMERYTIPTPELPPMSLLRRKV